MTPLFIGLGAVVLVFAASILRGYIFSILWGWFIVPTFHAPQLNTALAIGIMLTIGEMTRQYVPAKDDDAWMPVMTMVLLPLLALLLGWIVRFWL